jgi:nucleoporin NUP42
MLVAPTTRPLPRRIRAFTRRSSLHVAHPTFDKTVSLLVRMRHALSILFLQSPGCVCPDSPCRSDTMKRDMVDERPLWPLSRKSRAKYNNMSVLQARRVAHIHVLNQASFESEAIANAQAQYTKVINDPKAAHQAQFLLIEKGNAKPPAFGSSTSALGQPQTGFGSGTSAFGKSTTFGKPPTTSTFGQPSGTSPFGQLATSSTFSQPSTSTATAPAFGSSTSAFGRSSAFGQTTAPKPVFGAPAFGQPAFGPSGLGQSTSSSTPAIGSGGGGGFSAFAPKPATFGQPAFGRPGFGSSTSAPAFGQSGFGGSTTGSGAGTGTGTGTSGGGFSAFASSAPTSFAQAAANPLTSIGAFGSGASAFAQSASNPFGSSTQPTTNAFGQPIQPASGAFGSNTSAFAGPKPFTGFASAAGGGPPAFGPSPFGSTAPSANPFAASIAAAAVATGQPNPTVPTSVPFGLPPKPSGATITSAFAQLPGTTSAFSQPAKQGAFGGRLAVGPGGTIKVTDPYAGFLPRDYLRMLPPDVRAAFEADRFEPGKVPLWVPPMELR